MCLNKFCLPVQYPKGEQHARQRFAAVPVISRLRGLVTTRRRIVFKYTELIFQLCMFFLRTSLELTECVLHSVNQDYLQDSSFLIVQLHPIVRNFIITDNVCLHSENRFPFYNKIFYNLYYCIADDHHSSTGRFSKSVTSCNSIHVLDRVMSTPQGILGAHHTA